MRHYLVALFLMASPAMAAEHRAQAGFSFDFAAPWQLARSDKLIELKTFNDYGPNGEIPPGGAVISVTQAPARSVFDQPSIMEESGDEVMVDGKTGIEETATQAVGKVLYKDTTITVHSNSRTYLISLTIRAPAKEDKWKTDFRSFVSSLKLPS